MNKKGFTLVELIAAIVVLAILFFLAVPNVINYIKDSKANIMKVVSKNLKDSAIMYAKSNNINLSKCSPGFEVTNSNDTSSCLKKVTVGRLVLDGDFVDDANYCARNDIVVLYRYVNENGIDEIRAYVDSDTCNANNKDIVYDPQFDKIDKSKPICLYPEDKKTWTNKSYTITYGCDPENSVNGCLSKNITKTITGDEETVNLKWIIEDNVGNQEHCEYTLNSMIDKEKPEIKITGKDYLKNTIKSGDSVKNKIYLHVDLLKEIKSGVNYKVCKSSYNSLCTPYESYNKEIDYLATSKETYCFRAISNAGVESDVKCYNANIYKQKPIINVISKNSSGNVIKDGAISKDRATIAAFVENEESDELSYKYCSTQFGQECLPTNSYNSPVPLEVNQSKSYCFMATDADVSSDIVCRSIKIVSDKTLIINLESSCSANTEKGTEGNTGQWHLTHKTNDTKTSNVMFDLTDVSYMELNYDYISIATNKFTGNDYSVASVSVNLVNKNNQKTVNIQTSQLMDDKGYAADAGPTVGTLTRTDQAVLQIKLSDYIDTSVLADKYTFSVNTSCRVSRDHIGVPFKLTTNARLISVKLIY